MRIFTEASVDRNNQRPDILLRNPRGFGRQLIIDVAVTAIEGQSRTSDDLPDRPLRARYEQEMAKYGQIAARNNLHFVPVVFSHTGQTHGFFKSLLQEQIRQYSITFDAIIIIRTICYTCIRTYIP